MVCKILKGLVENKEIPQENYNLNIPVGSLRPR